MNKRYEISSEALLYAVLCLRKQGIYGVPAAMPPRSDRAFPVFAADAEKELMDLGLGTLDFDGKFTVEEEFGQLLGRCADCRDILGLSLFRDHTHTVCTVYLGAGGLLVRKADGSCELRGEDDLMEAVGAMLELPEGECTLTEVMADTDYLENQDLSALVASGCEEDAAKLILDGFSGSGHYAHLVHTRNRARAGELLLLYGPEGIYSAQAEYTNEREFLRMIPVGAGAVMQVIRDSAQKEGA